MNERLNKIYRYLSSQNIKNLPASYEEFEVMMQDDEKAQKIHSFLLSKNIKNVDADFNAFSDFVGRKKKVPTENIGTPSEVSGEEQSQLTTEDNEKVKAGKRFGDVLRSLKSGSLRALGGITGTPSFLNRTFTGFAVRPMVKAMGGTDEEANFVLDNLALGYSGAGVAIAGGSDAQRRLTEKAKKTEENLRPIEGTIWQNIADGNLADAGELLGRGVAQSIPYLAMTAVTAGGGTPAVLSTIAATSASQQYAELDGVAEPKRQLNAWLYGGFEAAGELVTASLFRGVGKTFRTGKIKGVDQSFAKGLGKEMAKSFGMEGSSEAGTQIGQNFTDIVTGVDENRNILSGVLDAFFIGGVSGVGAIGGGHALGAILGRTMASDKEVKQVQDNVKQQQVLIDQLEKTDSDPVKEALKKSIKDLRVQADEVMDTNYELAKKLTPEEQTEVGKLYSVWDELQDRIDSGKLAEDEIPAMENTIKGIKDQIQTIKDNLITRLDEQQQAEKQAKLDAVKEQEQAELDKLKEEETKKLDKVKDIGEGEKVNKGRLDEVKEKYDTKTEEVKADAEAQVEQIEKEYEDKPITEVEPVQKTEEFTEREQGDVFYTGRGEKFENIGDTRGEFIFFTKSKDIASWYGGDESNVTSARIDTSDFIDLTTGEAKAKFIDDNFTREDILDLFHIQGMDRTLDSRYDQKWIDERKDVLKRDGFTGGENQRFLLKKIKQLGYSGVKLSDAFFGEGDISYVVLDKTKAKVINQVKGGTQDASRKEAEDTRLIEGGISEQEQGGTTVNDIRNNGETGLEAQAVEELKPIIDYIKTLNEYESDGYDVERLRIAKEEMLADPQRTKIAMEIRDFARKIWGNIFSEKTPLAELRMFFYGDSNSVDEFAQNQIKGQEQEIKSRQSEIDGLNSKKKLSASDKSFIKFDEDKILSAEKEIEKIKSALSEWRQEKKAYQPQVTPKNAEISSETRQNDIVNEAIPPEQGKVSSENIPPQSTAKTAVKRKKKSSQPSDDMTMTDDGVEFNGKIYKTIDDVNEDFSGDQKKLTFIQQNKLKQLLRESEFDALNAYPKTDAPEELTWDSPLPMDSKENPNFEASDLNNAISLRNIARDLITNMGLKEGAQVRIGKVKRFSRKAQGLYFLDSGIVRVGSNTDLRVLSHELGHYIDHYLFNMRDIINMNNYRDVAKADQIQDPVLRDAELNKLRTKYGDSVVAGVLQRKSINKELKDFLVSINYPASQRTKQEALAEFVYNYVVDPQAVIKQTPYTYAWFEKLLDNAEPVKNALQQARKSFDLYKQQDPRAIIESHVSREKEDNGFLAGIRKLTRDKTIYSLLNNLKYGEKVSEVWRLAKEGKAESEKDPFLSLKGMLGMDGRVHQWLMFHPYFKKGNDVEIKKDIDGLLNILKPIIGTDKFKGYEDYLIAKRDVESYDNGTPKFAIESEKIAREAVRLFEEQYGKKELEDFQKKLQAYNDALLDFAYKSGKLSEEALNKIKALNRFYVPFKRVFEDYELNKGVGFSKEMLTTSASPIKSRKGSKRQLISPFESIIKNTYDILNSSERNITNKNMVDALFDIQKYALKHGESKGLIQEIPGNTIKPYFDTKTQEVRWGSMKEAPKGKIITVWEEGVAKYYEVAPEYYDVLYQNEAKVNEIVRVLSTPSRWLQAGAIVYDPTFPLRNIPRDQTSAWFYSKYGYNPTDFVRGIASALKKDDVFQRWLSSGADQSFLVASDQMLSKDYINKRIGRNLQRKFDAYKRNPLLFLQDFSRASEMGTRIGAFKNAYKKTGDVYKAMQEARDISADYGIHGASMRQIAPLYPFLNARTQHLRMINESSKNPAKFLMKGLAITAPALLIWLYNNQDDESKNLYQSLPTWRRVGLWNIRIPGTDYFFPIPKGFFGVLFGSSVEALLDDIVKKDERVVRELPDQLFKELSPIGNISEVVPFPIRPQVEMWANKKGYTGKTIIPEALKDLKPEQQYYDSTPEIFKEIGKATGISPLKLDHYIRSFFGGAGIGAINISDEILQSLGLVDEKAEDTFTTLSKMPVFKAVLTERPIGSYSGYVSDFYTTLDKIAGINKQVNKYQTAGDARKLEKYLSDPEIERMYKFYIGNETSINHFRYLLAGVRDLKMATMKDDLMSGSEKQQTIRDLDDILQKVALDFKSAYEKNTWFNIDESAKEIITQIKEKKTDIRQSIELQKNLYNPFWLQVKTSDPEIFEVIKKYDGFKDLRFTDMADEMDANELRLYTEKVVANYAKEVKSKIGLNKSKHDSLNKKRGDSEKTELEKLFDEAWKEAKERTKK